MKPVDQTLFRGEGEHGNCVPACIASILELPLDQVPHFAASHGTYFMMNMRQWFEDQGMGLGWTQRYIGGVHTIGTGKSPRGDFQHSVVYFGRKVVHDPHPSRAGLNGDADEFMVITKSK